MRPVKIAGTPIKHEPLPRRSVQVYRIRWKEFRVYANFKAVEIRRYVKEANVRKEDIDSTRGGLNEATQEQLTVTDRVVPDPERPVPFGNELH